MKSIPTYHFALVQARAYRYANGVLAAALRPYGITPTEWAFLGLLHDSPERLQLAEAAAVLGVEASFITALVKEMQAKKLVTLRSVPSDHRARAVTLTAAGNRVLAKAEASAASALDKAMSGLPKRFLPSYLASVTALASVSD